MPSPRMSPTHLYLSRMHTARGCDEQYAWCTCLMRGADVRNTLPTRWSGGARWLQSSSAASSCWCVSTTCPMLPTSCRYSSRDRLQRHDTQRAHSQGHSEKCICSFRNATRVVVSSQNVIFSEPSPRNRPLWTGVVALTRKRASLIPVIHANPMHLVLTSSNSGNKK